MYKKYIIFSICVLLSAVHMPIATANIHSHHAPTPGGVAVIPLAHDQTSPPLVTYQENRVLIIKNVNRDKKKFPWLAVVGIPLSVTPGTQSIKQQTSNGKKNIAFQVGPRSYQTQKINFKGYKPAAKKTKFLIALEQRIMREIKEIEAIYRHWLASHNIDQLQLQLPIQGRISSGFGVRRILNGVEKSPHSGLDIAAAEGTPVRAPKDGTVLKTTHFYLPGNAVFIDHGQGFITSYFHLKKISVVAGKKIKRGDTIGLVGKTGRATGPHLHWSVSLNGVRVDPLLFLAKRQKAG